MLGKQHASPDKAVSNWQRKSYALHRRFYSSRNRTEPSRDRDSAAIESGGSTLALGVLRKLLTEGKQILDIVRSEIEDPVEIHRAVPMGNQISQTGCGAQSAGGILVENVSIG